MNKKYMVYIDILGFKILPKIIEKNMGLRSDQTRNLLLIALKNKIDYFLEQGIISHSSREGDAWILLLDSIEDLFFCIDVFSLIDTGIPGFNTINFEIGIGLDFFDDINQPLVKYNQITDFIGINLFLDFRTKYKLLNDGKSIKETFSIFTQAAYESLEPLDKSFCLKHIFENDESVIYYSALKRDLTRRGSIMRFLTAIDSRQNKLYHRIDQVFLITDDLEDIKENLKEKKFTILFGPGEAGKTYLAIRVLWEYFLKGFNPILISGRGESERVQVRSRLLDIESMIKPKTIIFLEDPFGRYKYEKSEDLERNINSIVNTVKNKKDCFVLLTSREGLYNEFKSNISSTFDLTQHEMRIDRLLLNKSLQKSILELWVKERGCLWYEDSSLRDSVLEKTESLFLTPLMIKSFVYNSCYTTQKKVINEILQTFARSSVEAYEAEIKNIEKVEYIQFLCYPYIRYIPKEVAKQDYSFFTEGQIYADFEMLVKRFKGDKISAENHLFFTHSSYDEAFKNVLVSSSSVKRIFVATLKRIACMKPRIGALTLERELENIDLIYIKEIINSLMEFPTEYWIIAKILFKHYDDYSDIFNYCIEAFLKQGDLKPFLSELILANYEALPDNVRNHVLDFLDDFQSQKEVGWNISKSFNLFEDELKLEIIKKMYNQTGLDEPLVFLIVKNYSDKNKVIWDKLLNILTPKSIIGLFRYYYHHNKSKIKLVNGLLEHFVSLDRDYNAWFENYLFNYLDESYLPIQEEYDYWVDDYMDFLEMRIMSFLWGIWRINPLLEENGPDCFEVHSEMILNNLEDFSKKFNLDEIDKEILNEKINNWSSFKKEEYRRRIIDLPISENKRIELQRLINQNFEESLLEKGFLLNIENEDQKQWETLEFEFGYDKQFLVGNPSLYTSFGLFDVEAGLYLAHVILNKALKVISKGNYETIKETKAKLKSLFQEGNRIICNEELKEKNPDLWFCFVSDQLGENQCIIYKEFLGNVILKSGISVEIKNSTYLSKDHVLTKFNTKVFCTIIIAQNTSLVNIVSTE